MTLTPPPGLEECDFEAIEDAVLETARGRWFLREFARRARAADTSRLLDAVLRIEGAVMGRGLPIEGSVAGIEDHARALEERHGRLAEIAWMLRERGYDGDICAMIEKEARAVGRLALTLRGGAPANEPPRAQIEGPRAPPAPLDLPPPPVSATVEPPPAPIKPWREAAAAALAPIDRMPTRERLAFFA